jgi:hypothetical protein
MNNIQRLIQRRKAKNSYSEVYKWASCDPQFCKGFMKVATPVLTEKTYDMDGSEYERKSQAILEQSYEDNEAEDVHTKRQKDSGKAIKEESPQNPTSYFPGERR